jgi:POT family proton-dependent oligopeptide transporter
MKSTIMSGWLLTVWAGNVAVAIAARLNVFTGSAQFFFYAGFALVAAVVLGLVSRRYQGVDYYRAVEPKAAA